MPKSSTENRRPIAPRRSSTSSVLFGSSTTELSVTSSLSIVAGIRHLPISVATSPGKPGSTRSLMERLTAIGKRRPSSAHARHWRPASSITWNVSSLMRLVSLATGTNSLGIMRPRAGWCHRTRASRPDHPSAPHRDLRLVVQDELLVLDRMPQVGDQAEVRRGTGVHRCVVEGVPEVRVLGHVHRRVRATEGGSRRRLRRGGTRRCRCSRRGHGQPFEIDRLLDGPAHPCG